MITLGIVCPCYNEESILQDSSRRLVDVLDSLIDKQLISNSSVIMFVDDGSTDGTWEEIIKAHQMCDKCVGIHLSKNVGHQNAIMAGMMELKDHVDAVITIDVDLQDDIRAIEQMVLRHGEGAEIVYGVRQKRNVDSFFKRATARAFYKLQRKCNLNTIPNHADFRLMSSKALNALAAYPERNLYLRGIIPALGFKSATVEYDRTERQAGESKYTLPKMMNLAIDGITSFSIKPVYYIIATGVVMLIIALAMLVHVLVSYFMGNYVAGWPSLMISMWLIGSIIIISIGIVGLYIGKIYIETKQRPRYNIDSRIG